MINDFDLTPEEFKKKYPDEVIKKAETFGTHGVSKQVAKNYLETTEGRLFLKRVMEADPKMALENYEEIENRAISQLTSGAELPRMEIINEPLVKIVPKGGRSPDYSPYWTTESEFNAAIADGKNLSKHFGLPISSESAEYDIYKITPKQPTEVFINHVARTTELKDADTVFKQGGATQYLTPNRQLFEPAERIGQVQNRVFIPHQKDLQIPSDLKNPAIQTIGGINRTELATMSDELIAQGYAPAQAFEAVNSALKERLATSASQNLGIVFEAKIIMKNDVAYVEFSAPSMEKMGMDKQDFPIKNLKTSVKEALKEGLSLHLENQVLSEKIGQNLAKSMRRGLN